MGRISDLVREGFKETRKTGGELKKATTKLSAYHDKKYPVTIIARVTEGQAKKLGENKSQAIRDLIDNEK